MIFINPNQNASAYICQMYHQSSREAEWEKWFTSDASVHELYPQEIRDLARRHWTPLLVAKKAASFLVTAPGDRILDIGSGAGKFCLAAGFHHPQARFTGIEQREYLVEHANSALKTVGLPNVNFIHGNFTQVDFRQYDHFYFYNSFYENLAYTEKIDEQIEYSTELFDYYSHYLYKQLCNAPDGTRLVTYHSLETEIPAAYHVVHTDINDYLKCWIKV